MSNEEVFMTVIDISLILVLISFIFNIIKFSIVSKNQKQKLIDLLEGRNIDKCIELNLENIRLKNNLETFKISTDNLIDRMCEKHDKELKISTDILICRDEEIKYLKEKIEDPSSKLKRSNKNKSEGSYYDSLNAIIQLETENKKINFSSVSKKAGVSTNYLYKNEELKSMIEERRGLKVQKSL